MKLYVNNLIPRLKEFSENLDKKEIFIEKPWVIVDENLNLQKYIFKRNGELVMSHNGEVTLGKWEYLIGAKSILIDRVTDKILLNQNFIDPAVMILKKDGYKDENVILVNEVLIPDLNANDYLKKLFYQKHNISIITLKSGIELECLNHKDQTKNNLVTIEGEQVPDSIFEHSEYKKKYVIKDSRIHKILVAYSYKTNNGEIVIEQDQYYGFLKGDYVFKNNFSAPDGKYRLGFMNYIFVENGKIIRISKF